MTKTSPSFPTISLATADADPEGLRQSALPFAPRVEGEPAFCPSAAQSRAQDQLKRYILAAAQGPGLTAILLFGPRDSGKTRLLSELVWSEPSLEVEHVDVDQASPLEVFGEINRAAAARQPLVIEGRGRPARWFAGSSEPVPPDLTSRLNAAPAVEIDAPGAEALLPVLAADATRHGLRLKEEELRQIAEALPRGFGAPRHFCRVLETADPALARRARLQWATQIVHVARGETN